MPQTRLSSQASTELALDDLVQLGALLTEVDIEVTGPDQVSVRWGADDGWPALVLSYDAIDEAVARQMVATAARGHKIAVANRISDPARRYLTSSDWAWLDRRIGAHLPLGHRDVEIRFAGQPPAGGRADGEPVSVPGPPRPSSDGPIRGRAGISYAAALLCSPRRPPSFRAVAAAVDMSPTAVSNAAKLLNQAGLLGPDNEPLLPDLFWALASVWAPLKAVAVSSVPSPEDPQLGFNRGHLTQAGAALGGDLAAAELGAPLFTTEARPWLWLPSQVGLRRAARACGTAAWSDRAAVLAAPPTLLMCQHRLPSPPGGRGWPLPRPVFAALDLAQDRERGREILDGWSPEGVEVVWR